MEPKTVVPKLRSLLRFDKLFRFSICFLSKVGFNGRHVSQFFMTGKSLCLFVFPATAENNILIFPSGSMAWLFVRSPRPKPIFDEMKRRSGRQAVGFFLFHIGVESKVSHSVFELWLAVWFEFNLFEHSRNYVCVFFRVRMMCM